MLKVSRYTKNTRRTRTRPVAPTLSVQAGGSPSPQVAWASVGFCFLPALYFLISFLPFPGEKDVVILGDFGQGPDSSDYDILRREKFYHLIPAHTFTNISTRNPQGSKSVDNIWISKSLKKVFTGRGSASHPRAPYCLCSVVGRGPVNV